MWQNHLKITLRTLWNNKLYTFINMMGLGISMAVVILIAVYVSFELSFDNSQYKKDIQLSRIFAIFGGLSIFISCLGLFGLSSFLIQQRTKEIGIRKILGASLRNLFALLTKNYMRLVVFASIIATPIAYLGIKKWLEDYAFRIELSWWFFVVPILVLLVIAIATIGYKIIKTAKANPVEALRYE